MSYISIGDVGYCIKKQYKPMRYSEACVCLMKTVLWVACTFYYLYIQLVCMTKVDLPPQNPSPLPIGNGEERQ